MILELLLYVSPVMVVKSESESLSNTRSSSSAPPRGSSSDALSTGSSLERGCEREVYMDQSMGMRRSVIKP